MKTDCKKQIKKSFRIEKVTKRKGHKLCWKGYNILFNDWVDKKDTV